jgi:tRNA threonylcarbamoyl adenosine modification protein (Sua5/YciO/YrdC/YwlC family)
MIVTINSDNIDDRIVNQTIEVLKKGGLIIFPTDSVYAIGCDLYNKKALDRLAKFKNVKLNKANFSIICTSMSDLSQYVKQFDRSIFKLLNSTLPGPFTYILPATSEIPKIFESTRKDIGIRIPNNPIILKITEKLGNPIATTSLKNENSMLEYFNDPQEIYDEYDDVVDLIIDGGIGNIEGSTVVDCTSGAPEIIRQGLGIL